MPLAACQEIVDHSLDLSSMSEIFNMVQLIEGAIDCSSSMWLMGVSHPVLTGMILGGFGFGVIKRVLRSSKGGRRQKSRKSRNLDAKAPK